MPIPGTFRDIPSCKIGKRRAFDINLSRFILRRPPKWAFFDFELWSLAMRTWTVRPGDIERKWYIVDAEDLILGRLSTEIARILRGKHRPQYTPHADCGDHVIVINAEKIKVTGRKEEQTTYYRHSQYPGGLKSITLEKQRERFPERIIELAVKGMMPKNSLGRSMLKKLKVYAGSDHPHTAQQPETLKLN
jgi:large subunit ribosomal protein L13